MTYRGLSLLASVLLSLSLRAEKVLVPVVIDNRWWVTEVHALNLSETEIPTPGIYFNVHCPLAAPCPGDWIDAEILTPLFEPRSQAGLVIDIPDERSGDVVFTARFCRARSSRCATHTQLPVVRESDFRRGPIRLAHVPISTAATERTHLRIYTLDDGPVDVMVRIHEFASLDPRWVKTEVLVSLQRLEAPQPPGFAIVDLGKVSDSFHAPAISVEPVVPPGAPVPRIWAFVTHTDERTDRTTVITAD